MTQPVPPKNNATLPLTYPDAVCTLDLDPMGRETTSDLQTLVQDVFHILLEDFASNPDDTTRGVGVNGMLSGATANTFPGIEKRVPKQLLQDDRISTCTAKLTQDPGTGVNGIPASFTLALTIGVGTAVIGLSFSWSAAGGLQFNPWQVLS